MFMQPTLFKNAFVPRDIIFEFALFLTNDLEAILIKKELEWKPGGDFWRRGNVLPEPERFANNTRETQLKENDGWANLTGWLSDDLNVIPSISLKCVLGYETASP